MILNLLKFFIFSFLSYNFTVICDAPVPLQLGLQDPATTYMEGIIHLHNDLCFLILTIAIFVSWLLGKCLVLYTKDKHQISEKFTHSTLLEIVWTVVPAVILMIIAIPSFALLYSLDEFVSPMMTLKVVGHQWYWSYEYSDFMNAKNGQSANFDSYMQSEDDLRFGYFRLLEVDNRVVLPVNTPIRVLVTAADVLHSWAIPSLGVKVDACPGRLNQVSLFLKREGLFYGQCSEICGVNHGFMPIVIQSKPVDYYMKWLEFRM